METAYTLVTLLPQSNPTGPKPLLAGECTVYARQGTGWSNPLVRTISEAQLPPLPWDALLLDRETISDFFHTLLGFTECCLSTFTLVEQLTPEDSLLRPLAIRIIRQYATYLLLPSLMRLNAIQSQEDNEFRANLAKLRQELEDLRDFFEHDQNVGPDWVAATIFFPAFAGLALHFPLNSEHAARKRTQLKTWQKTCKKFLHLVAAFDTSNYLIGESLLRWNKFKLLQNWEKALRDTRFQQPVRSLLANARSTLKQGHCILEIEINNKAEQNKLIENGRKELYGAPVYKTITTPNGLRYVQLHST
jgi:hypothetical protein